MLSTHLNLFTATTFLLTHFTAAQTPYTSNILATFDDLSSTPMAVYNSLSWPGLSLTNLTSSTLVPDSPNNAASFSPDSSTLQLQPGTTVDYPSSTVDAFDLRSFYYGCGAARSGDGSVVGATVNCTITVKGHVEVGGNKTVVQQSFGYGGGVAGKQQGMARADLRDEFVGLRNVEWFVSGKKGVVAFLDTVAYTVYGK
ncbi:hypothetical protein EJ04DRAFT_608865 [Polyplosphaeria fusca]|uniref:Dirigent protein n=1 Tax=Polyplosphaeria fusca TaxID=682080 RepID=A0A9P4QWC6_9PLEO|nr:hypothetical protein EJ04DRAFT_608865 [Polyplosphaeria fusca]